MKIALKLNETFEGTLKSAPPGKYYPTTIPGKDGGAVMYSLTSIDPSTNKNNVLFLEDAICDEPDRLLQEAHIGARDTFRLTIRMRNGQRYYEVHKLGDAQEPQRHSAQGPAPMTPFDALPTEIDATPLARQLTQSINQANQRKAERVISAPAQPQSTQQSSTPQSTPNSSNNTAPIAHTVISKLMAASLIAAFDATQECQRYASAHGIEFEFQAEDICAISNTIFIALSKDPAFGKPQPVNGGAQPWQQ